MSETIDLVKDSTMKDVAAAIRGLGEAIDLTDYKEIVKAIRTGNGKLVPNGTCFQVPHAVYGNIDFITRRQNVDKVVGEPDRPTLTIQTKYCISVGAGTSAATFQYDRPEAFKKVTEAIPAGTVCKFTTIAYGGWAAGTYNFTASDTIAAGSMLCMSGYESTAMTSSKVRVYANAKATSHSAEYAISSGAGDATVDLGTWGTDCNHPQRVSYGNNNEAESNILQFLNGDSGNAYMDSIFVPKNDYDMMCTSFTSLKGFLGGFPDDFRECLGLCSVHNITNNVYENSGYATGDEYTHNSYFWLPSRKEIYGSNETAKEASESQFPYYANIGLSNADKLGYAKGASSATTEWLRTSNAGSASYVRIVYAGSGGALSGYYAYDSGGVRPLAILA